MKRFSLLFSVLFISTSSLQAMLPGFVPGPAIMLHKIQKARCIVPHASELIVPVALQVALRGFGYHGFDNNSWLKYANLASETLQKSQRLTEQQEEDGCLEATSLNSATLRFASCLSQHIVYKQVVCRLVQKLAVYKQLQEHINRACNYHWTTMVGVTVLEQLALMTTSNVCQQYLLKPLCDCVLGLFDRSDAPSINETETLDNIDKD